MIAGHFYPALLFNKITEVKPYKTNSKDVNNNAIEFTAQTNASVKTNIEETDVPRLHFRKTENVAVIGTRLDASTRNYFNDDIRHNIQLDKREKDHPKNTSSMIFSTTST